MYTFLAIACGTGIHALRFRPLVAFLAHCADLLRGARRHISVVEVGADGLRLDDWQ